MSALTCCPWTGEGGEGGEKRKSGKNSREVVGKKISVVSISRVRECVCVCVCVHGKIPICDGVSPGL